MGSPPPFHFFPSSFSDQSPANKVTKSLAQVVPVYKGEDGQSGASKNCYGRNGKTTYINVSVQREKIQFKSVNVKKNVETISIFFAALPLMFL